MACLSFCSTIIAGCVLLWCGAQALDCQDKNSIQQEQLKCFRLLQLSPNVGSGGEIQNVIQNDPTTVCRQQDEFQRALTCAFDVGKNCLQEVGVRTDILPNADRMADGIAYMCQHLSEIDPYCSKNSEAALHQCVVDKFYSRLENIDTTDIKAITCTSFQLAYDCMKETLGHCRGRTLEVLLELTNRYMRPSACSPFDGSADNLYNGGEVAYRFTTMAPLINVQLLTTTMALPEVSCYSEQDIQQAQQQCLKREGLDIDLAQINLRSGMQAKQSYLDAILANNQDIHTVCRERVPRQRAMACAMDVARKCMPSGYKDYLPDSSRVGNIVDELCANADNVDFQCATSKASDLYDCGYRKGSQYGGDGNTQDLLCKVFHWNVDCQIEVMRDCGCRTMELYVKIGKQLIPPACPAIRTPTPQCDAKTGGFKSVNGAPSMFGLSAVLMTIGTVLGLRITA